MRRLTVLLVALLAAACASAPEREEGALGGRDVRVAFDGLVQLSASELEGRIADELADFERSGYRKWPIDDAAYQVEERFRSAGFPFASVDYRVDVPPEGAILVHFAVEPGPRTRLVDVRFEGVSAYSPDTLRTFFGLAGDDPVFYSASAVGSGLSALEQRYLNDGWVDVRIGEPLPLFGAARETVTVTVPVLEGTRFELRATTVQAGEVTPPAAPELEPDAEGEAAEAEAAGAEAAEGEAGADGGGAVDEPESGAADSAAEARPEPDEAAAEAARREREEVLRTLRERAAERVGETFRLRLPYEIRGALLEVLGEHGYVHARAEIHQARDEEEGAVDLTYVVDLGPRVVVDAVEVRGNEETRTSVILDRVSIEPGDVYTRSAERQSFERLYRLGVFRGVRLTPEQRPDGRSVLVVEVEEDLTAEWFVEPGYGSYERARLTLGFRERNFLGRAVPVRFEVTGGPLAVRGEASIAQPGLFGIDPDTTGEVSFFGEEREEPSFTKEEVGVEVGVSRRWSRQLQTAVEYQLRNTEVTKVLSQDPDAQAALDDFDISSISLSASHDTRNNFLEPSAGRNTRGSVEFADETFGSDLDFTRLHFIQSWYQLLQEGTVLAIGLRGGAIFPRGRTEEIPLQELFFNGGENTVRSFEEDELGPDDGFGKPTGGEAYTALTVELRQQLSGPLGAAAFVDFGTLSARAEDLFEFGSAVTGLAVGLGLRYDLPIGPIRVDVGWNPDANADQSDVVAHLSVGMPF